MVDLSIVIPSYNSRARLLATLDVIARQTDVDPSRLETIVVDDGSDDGTRAAVEAMPNVRYVFRPRDAQSGRARARNLGVEVATAPLILFVDAGVLPGPGLVGAAMHPEGDPANALVLYKTLGVFAHGSLAPDIEPLDLLASISILERHPAFQDLRDPFMSELEGRAEAMPAPWLFAWTCALSVPRRAVLTIGGFDTEYKGWGAEDVDLGARLKLAGMTFYWRGDVLAIHVPHDRERDQSHTHRLNAFRLHRKLGTRDTELFTVWLDAFTVNIFGARLDLLRLGAVVPEFGIPLTELGARGSGRRLCVGLRWSTVVEGLQPSVVLVHQPGLKSKVKALWPEAEVHCLLGIALPFDDGAFDQVIIGDLIRLMPPRIQMSMLKELVRVSSDVRLLLFDRSPARIVPEDTYREVSGWSWSSPGEIVETAVQSGFQVTRELRTGDAIVICVSPDAVGAEL